MIGILAKFSVDTAKAAEFEAFFGALAAKVHANEPGAKLYQLAKSRKDAGAYTVLELYADQAAFDHHGSTDYFKAAFPKLKDFFTAPPQLEFLDTVG